MTKNQLAKQEFIALMLLHGAHSDFNYSEPEKNLIKNILGKEILTKVESIYQEKNDLEMDLLFIQHFDIYLNTKSKKDSFFKSMELLFQSDGVYCRFEQFFDKYYRRLATYV